MARRYTAEDWYDGPTPAQERRAKNLYRCGGAGSWDGPCGAEDCTRCNPGWNGVYDEDEDDDE